MQAVQEAKQAGCAIVDELSAVAIVADRFQLRIALADMSTATGGRIQLPSAQQVLDGAALQRMSGLCLRQPPQAALSSGANAWLVKPRVACGVDEAHKMALVLHPSALPTQVRAYVLAPCSPSIYSIP
jgi:hypothetical protein